MRSHRVPSSRDPLLRSFLDGAGDSLQTFRYFGKRPLEVVDRHLCTWLWLDEEDEPVAYGHLDPENGTTWLGIAVQQAHRGKGFGSLMMTLLLDAARGAGITRIRLSVDATNAEAIALYERNGFVPDGEKEPTRFFACDLLPPEQAVMSSLAFMGQPAEAMVRTAVEEGFALEFSSGMPYHEHMEWAFVNAPIRRFAHNYFPAPKDPFVLNLGSANEAVRERSIAHCVKGIELSYASGAPFFSAHAGFCVDPRPSELGTRLDRVPHIDRERHWALFTAAVRQVLAATRDLPTGFLIENNVLAPVNRYDDGTIPLLCVDADEQLRLLADVPDSRLGLLFDTAHFKVSAATLGFDRVQNVRRLLPSIRCVHHSDNDGRVDDNRPLDAGYWFLPLMPAVRHAVHVLEVRQCAPEALRRMEGLLFPPRA